MKLAIPSINYSKISNLQCCIINMLYKFENSNFLLFNSAANIPPAPRNELEENSFSG